jgi:phage-related protein
MVMHWTVEVLDQRVADEIEAWPVPLRAALTRIIERIEAVGLERVYEPHVKHVRGKIWEMRPGAAGLEGRALYLAVSGARVVIVVAFQKKTRKTPSHYLDLAETRAKGLQQ